MGCGSSKSTEASKSTPAPAAAPAAKAATPAAPAAQPKPAAAPAAAPSAGAVDEDETWVDDPNGQDEDLFREISGKRTDKQGN